MQILRLYKKTNFLYSDNLLAGCQIESEGNSCLLSQSLKLLSYDEVSIVMEDKLIRKRIEE